MTNQTWPGEPRPSIWSRLTTGQKTSLVGAAVLIVVLGVLMLIGAAVSPSGRPAPHPETSAPASRSRPQKIIAFGPIDGRAL